jgi:hypothetical protein
MKILHQIFEAQEHDQKAKELLQIIDKPSLTPGEIWNLFPNNFYKDTFISFATKKEEVFFEIIDLKFCVADCILYFSVFSKKLGKKKGNTHYACSQYPR